MSNLQQRIISAVILAAIVLALTWFGGWSFRLLCAVLGAAIYYEWSAMSARPETQANHMVGAVGLGITLITMFFGASAGGAIAFLAVAVIVTFVHAANAGRDRWATSGVAYAGLSAIAIAYLRGDIWAGFLAIIYLFAVVWATDIFAYFVGRAVGGPKLAPSISPGKTRSGAVGGVIAAIIAALIFGWAAKVESLFWLAVVAVILSVVSQAGDLFESWVKRRHGVKDSGRIIPGHGGVMDRVDGLVAAGIVLYIIGAGENGLNASAIGLFG